jgi:hypothetical protein
MGKRLNGMGSVITSLPVGILRADGKADGKEDDGH